MPFLLPLLTSRLFLEFLALAALVLFAFGLKHSYDERRRSEGRAEFAAVSVACADELAAHTPKECALAVRQSVADGAQLKSNNATLAATIGRQNDAVKGLADAGTKARAAALAAQKQSDDDAVFYAERLAGLKQNLQYPSKEPNADADRILRALAIDRRVLGK